MYDEIRKKLFFLRKRIMFNIGVNNGQITNFEDEIFDAMSDTIITCFPVSFQIKYSGFMFAEGTCYDRSLYMFLALDNAIRVTGNHLDLEYRYGTGHGGHGWVEIGDYVYDPSTMLKHDKNLYYKMYGVSDINSVDKETYLKEHAEFVKTHVTTDFDEFRPGGVRRLELGILVRQVVERAELEGNKEVLDELNKYLSSIQYDPVQIKEELDKRVEELMKLEALEYASGKGMV